MGAARAARRGNLPPSTTVHDRPRPSTTVHDLPRPSTTFQFDLSTTFQFDLSTTFHDLPRQVPLPALLGGADGTPRSDDETSARDGALDGAAPGARADKPCAGQTCRWLLRGAAFLDADAYDARLRKVTGSLRDATYGLREFYDDMVTRLPELRLSHHLPWPSHHLPIAFHVLLIAFHGLFIAFLGLSTTSHHLPRQVALFPELRLYLGSVEGLAEVRAPHDLPKTLPDLP